MTEAHDAEVRSLLDQIDRPMTASELCGIASTELSETAVRASLRTWSEAGTAFAWPKGRYWSKDFLAGLRPVIPEVLSADGTTMSQLHAALPAAYRVDIGTLREVVNKLVGEGTLCGWGPSRDFDAKRRGVSVFSFDPNSSFRSALEGSLKPEPRALADLFKTVDGAKPTQAVARSIVEDLVHQGVAHRWRVGVYGSESPMKVLKQRLAPILWSEALTSTQIRKKFPFSVPPALIAGVLREAQKDQAIIAYRTGRSTVYGSSKAIAALIIEQAGTRYGVDRAAFISALGLVEGSDLSSASWTPAEKLESDEDLIDVIRRIRAQQRLSYVPIGKVRSASLLSAERLGAELIRLGREGLLHLVRHDRPHPNQADVVVGPSGKVFGGIILNEDGDQ